ncbi:hypothetical protein [Phytomonospora endophytica]|uniref:Uncharacterized protein n=1 Tax=Phytomonospora endophytica TaxID=714109 RepID=A0A841FPS3_9ACTN|nr:hypothetical protein [Phytomonospora endophytica]MBB6039301.1 hypothetical protein [Phytomonospora endophytica]GIG69757.1 hypothetical protein Pen01_60520 [Phytomonospora endophytica]
MTAHEYEKSFAEAWADPRHTLIHLPDLDVNAVLAERYEVAEPLTFTRTMLWDMEVRKARRPDLYIPVADKASVRSWGDDPTYTRVSEQWLWKDMSSSGLIIEKTHLNHETRTVTFLGAAEAVDDRGETVTATTAQPLFHVEHGAAGTEERPLNTWRLVSLTDAPDGGELSKVFDQIMGPYLPPFLEYYIENVLKIGFRRRG